MHTAGLGQVQPCFRASVATPRRCMAAMVPRCASVPPIKVRRSGHSSCTFPDNIASESITGPYDVNSAFYSSSCTRRRTDRGSDHPLQRPLKVGGPVPNLWLQSAPPRWQPVRQHPSRLYPSQVCPLSSVRVSSAVPPSTERFPSLSDKCLLDIV